MERSIQTHNLKYDFSRQLFDDNRYYQLLDEMREKVLPKIERMKSGEKINFTEKRSVGHFILRANEENSYYNEEVSSVLNKIDVFIEAVHSGKWLSSTGKKFKNVVSIGIGGSYLGIDFFYKAINGKKHMDLRLLANIDPFDLHKSLEGLNAEETLVIVISKTFTTQETMINAESVKSWLISQMGDTLYDDVVSKHMVAVSTNLEKVAEFGIEKVFGFWDWVGGRYSVWSAVGLLPLGLVYGMDIIEQVLEGAHSADNHFFNEPVETNIPVHMALIAVDSVERGFNNRAILPYSQALERFPAHIQQVEMESNGKYIDENGNRIKKSGQVIFGEPGTNGQHSFYQLLHQGCQIVPCEFIGFCRQTFNFKKEDEILSNHDELMCNFFAQADALYYGKTEEEVLAEGCSKELVPHKVFEGGRPSTLLLFNSLTNFNLGYLLALYEHYISCEGFYWGINSFDQWGVELGKKLAGKVKEFLEGDCSIEFNSSTQEMLKYYLKNRRIGGL